MKARAVTFDFGQVLASFDPAYLAEKIGEGDVAGFERAMPAAWAAYGASLRTGGHGSGAWKTFVRVVLEGGGVEATEERLQSLFLDQKHNNLWRRPVPGMIELLRSLRARGVPVAIVSNSEGALANLVASLGWTADSPIVADSGVLGFEKPGPEIFHWTGAQLGVAASDFVHVGDSWAADVVGALGVGARAVWFVENAEPTLPPDAAIDRIATAASAPAVERAIERFLA